MIALGAPLALLGLLALPAIFWLHRRRRRPAPVVVPSLLFLEEEDAASLAPEHVRFDAELVVALVAAALLALGAADPSRTPEPGRTVRIVVAESPSLAALGEGGVSGRERAQAVVADVRGRLSGRDLLEEWWVEGGLDAALAAARSGEAGLRLVVADRLPSATPPDVRFVAVGDPAARNAGIVAAHVAEDGAARRVFANVRNDAPGDLEGRLALVRAERTDEQPVRLGPHEAHGYVFDVATPLPPGAALSLTPGGALALDDRVVLSRAPLRVGFEPPPHGYPEEHLDAVRTALTAVSPGWTVDAARPELWVGSRASTPDPRALVLVLHPVPRGTDGVRPGAAALAPIGLEWGRGLDLAGADLVYDPAVVAAGPPFPVVLSSSVDGVKEVHWLPDPLAGSPAPADHPVWPLFVENVVRGLSSEGPARDPDATLLGRAVASFDPAWLESARRDRVARPRSLRPVLALGGGLCLLWLWIAPLLRRPRAA